jgi:hypothetical protein
MGIVADLSERGSSARLIGMNATKTPDVGPGAACTHAQPCFCSWQPLPDAWPLFKIAADFGDVIRFWDCDPVSGIVGADVLKPISDYVRTWSPRELEAIERFAVERAGALLDAVNYIEAEYTVDDTLRLARERNALESVMFVLFLAVRGFMLADALKAVDDAAVTSLSNLPMPAKDARVAYPFLLAVENEEPSRWWSL